MPSKRPPITQFSAAERRVLLTRSRLIHRQNECDIRGRKRESGSSNSIGRILIVTPKKIGSAPKRNLIRRRFKALYYEDKFYVQGYDIVIYCKVGSADLTYQNLQAILQATFIRLPTSEKVF